MSSRCPQCDRLELWPIKPFRQGGGVDHFRCEFCDTVWSAPKDAEAAPRVVAKADAPPGACLTRRRARG